MFATKEKQYLKENKGSLSKKNSDNRERKSNHQYQTINDNPTKTFNDSKNTKQTKEFLNANENCPFETIIN
jgi:hypothetical protein